MRGKAGAAPATVSRCGRSLDATVRVAHGKADRPALGDAAFRIPTSPETGLPPECLAFAHGFRTETHRGEAMSGRMPLVAGLSPERFLRVACDQPPCGD